MTGDKQSNNLLRAGSLSRRFLLFGLISSLFLLALGAIALERIIYAHSLARVDSELQQILLDLVSDTTVVQAQQTRLLVGANFNDTRFELPYGGWYWQAHSLTLPDMEAQKSISLLNFDLAQLQGLSAGQDIAMLQTGPNGQLLRVNYKAWHSRLAGQTMLYVVARDVTHIKQEQQQLQLYLLLFVLAWVLALLCAQAVQIWLSLQPLRRAREDIIAIRTAKKSKMEQDYPLEIQDLSQQVNFLIEDNIRIISNARNQVGNLAHGLKTPLAVIKNALQEQRSAIPQASKEQAQTDNEVILQNIVLMQSQAENMTTLVERYLAQARAAALGQARSHKTPVLELLEPLARTLEKIFQDKALRVDLDVPQSFTLPLEAQDLQEVLGNLLENAGKWARSKAFVRALTQDEQNGEQRLVLRIEDDGVGVADDQFATILKRGARLDEQTQGTGLGLSIVADLMQAYHGQLDFSRSEHGGLCVTLSFRMPQA